MKVLIEHNDFMYLRDVCDAAMKYAAICPLDEAPMVREQVDHVRGLIECLNTASKHGTFR